MFRMIAVDNEGAPLRSSIIWCDSQAATIENKAFNAIGVTKCNEQLLNSLGNFTAPKLKWVKENEPEICSRG